MTETDLILLLLLLLLLLTKSIPRPYPRVLTAAFLVNESEEKRVLEFLWPCRKTATRLSLREKQRAEGGCDGY
jgi:hypothetical protein